MRRTIAFRASKSPMTTARERLLAAKMWSYSMTGARDPIIMVGAGWTSFLLGIWCSLSGTCPRYRSLVARHEGHLLDCHYSQNIFMMSKVPMNGVMLPTGMRVLGQCPFWGLKSLSCSIAFGRWS